MQETAGNRKHIKTLRSTLTQTSERQKQKSNHGTNNCIGSKTLYFQLEKCHEKLFSPYGSIDSINRNDHHLHKLR